MGTMARLGLDFGWPAEVLGMQSKDWAFDFVVYHSSDTSERIVGEVKKTAVEVDSLIADLSSYGKTGATAPLSSDARHLNSFKKWVSLVKSKVPLFWAVGPGNYTRLFEMHYAADGTATFSDVSLAKLSATTG